MPDAQYFQLDEKPGDIAARLAKSLEADPRYRWKQRVLREYSWERIFRQRIEPLLQEVMTHVQRM